MDSTSSMKLKNDKECQPNGNDSDSDDESIYDEYYEESSYDEEDVFEDEETDDIADSSVQNNEDENVFVDRFGKKWLLFAKIRDEQHLAEICQQQWLRKSQGNQKTTFFQCRWSGVSSKHKHDCALRAIYVKARAALFTMNEHNHELTTGMPGKSKKFTSIDGKAWHLLTKLRDQAHLKQICLQQSLKRQCSQEGTPNMPAYFAYRCADKHFLKCKFRGRFFPGFRSFYVSGKHFHVDIEAAPELDIGGASDGRHFKKMYDGIEGPPELEREISFDEIEIEKPPELEKEITVMESNGIGDVIANQSEVINNANFQQNKPNSKTIYVDATGTNWYFSGTAKTAQELTKLLKSNWIRKSHEYNSTTASYRCRKSTKNGCKFKGIFLKQSCNLYIRNEHNHPIVADTNTPKGHDDYVDRSRQHWHFLATVDNTKELAVLLKENWLFKGQKCRNKDPKAFYICRRKYIRKRFGGERCRFKAIFLKANSAIYTMGEHNHPMREMETPKDTEEYFDIFGKNWPFFARITDNAHLNQVANKNCLKIFRRTQSTIKATCRYQQKHDCPVRATFLKSNSTLYLREEHNHEFTVPNEEGGRSVQKRKRKESSNEEDELNEDELSSEEEDEDMDFEDEDDSEEETDSEMEIDENEKSQDDEHFHSEEGNEVEEESQILNGNAAKEVVENIRENGQQNEENPAAMEPPPELEVEIVDEVNHQEYKMLPPMKRECEANNAGSREWPTVTIESEVAGWQWQQTRRQKEAFLRPVKKEEPADELPEEPLPNQPSTSNANVNQNAGPHKMYLRARKPVNYAGNRFGK